MCSSGSALQRSHLLIDTSLTSLSNPCTRSPEPPPPDWADVPPSFAGRPTSTWASTMKPTRRRCEARFGPGLLRTSSVWLFFSVGCTTPPWVDPTSESVVEFGKGVHGWSKSPCTFTSIFVGEGGLTKATIGLGNSAALELMMNGSFLPWGVVCRFSSFCRRTHCTP